MMTAHARIRERLAIMFSLLILGLCPRVLGQTADESVEKAEKGRQVANEARRRDTGFGDSSAELVMILRGRGGDEKRRELRSITLEVPDDGDKSVVIFKSPPDVKGTALLTYAHRQGADDQWLYLPALKRVKRIGASNKSGPFMGSEFSYEDLASQEIEKYEHRWIRDESCPGQDFKALSCFVIERYPEDANSGYSRQTVWIDRSEYRTLKIEFYDRKGFLLKTLTLGAYERYAGRFWRSREMLMANHQTGTSTQLLWSSYAFRGGLTDRDFTPEALARGR
jgi:hypothetical protein